MNTIEGDKPQVSQSEITSAMKDLELDIPEDERSDPENSPVTEDEMKAAVEALSIPDQEQVETKVVETPEQRQEEIEKIRQILSENEEGPEKSSGGSNDNGENNAIKGLFEEDKGDPLLIHNVPYFKKRDGITIAKEVFGTGFFSLFNFFRPSLWKEYREKIKELEKERSG